jgi:hypothetical protein
MQFQTELRESLTKVDEEPPSVSLMLEPGHEVIGSCRVSNYAEDWPNLQ